MRVPVVAAQSLAQQRRGEARLAAGLAAGLLVNKEGPCYQQSFC